MWKRREKGFVKCKKRNQEIRPETLNSHPRSLSCPKCTLLPKVTETFSFVLKLASALWGFTPSDSVDDPDMDDPVMDGCRSMAFLFLRGEVVLILKVTDVNN